VPSTVWPERVWPLDSKAGAPLLTLAGALAAGAVGAAALHASVGAGFVVTVATVLGVAFLRQRPTPPQAVAAALTLGLLGLGGYVAAPWIFTLCVLAAWGTGLLALTEPATWVGMFLGVWTPAFAPARVVGWTVRGVQQLRGVAKVPILRILAVAGVSAGLLLAFGALFATADKVFANMLDSLFGDVSVGDAPGRTVIFALVTATALGAAYLVRHRPTFDALAPSTRRPLRRWEWAVPLALLDLLFVSFVVVQLTVLFGGRTHVLETADLTYAQYARQGFWQLLVVTGLTLAVIAVAARKAGVESRKDRVLVRVLLGVLCAMALVIVASAMRRMGLYEETFGFTRLRLLVTATELWLGLVFVFVIGAGVRMRGRWLPRAVVGTGALVLLGLGAMNPDAYIAERNVDRYHDTGKIDVEYLAGLSADAVPALDTLPAGQRACALVQIADDLDSHGDDQWYEYNVGRSRARAILTDRPVGDTSGCYTASDYYYD
jgi:hypothetical protein